jgi:hypothetical protein
MEHESPDPPFSSEQTHRVAHLTQEQLKAIDAALFAQCAGSWRKVSHVVGSALLQFELPGIPDVFFVHRVKEHGFYPVNADTSKKAQNGPKGVSCQSEENSAKSSSAKPWSWFGNPA